MLSLDYIRNNKAKVIEAAKNKNRLVDIDKIILLDSQRRELILKIQTIRVERNKSSHQKPDAEVIKRGKEIKEELKNLESNLAEIEKKINELLSQVPNVPLDEVPI